MLSHECGLFVQFVKYGVVGVMATCVQLSVFYALAATTLKCLGPDDWAVRVLGFPAASVTDSERAFLAAIATGGGFVAANLFCWVMNRLFVFKPGRHAWWLELAFFFAVSLIALGVGLAVQTVLIHLAGWTTSAAVFLEILSSLAINFVVRKFFVFKG